MPRFSFDRSALLSVVPILTKVVPKEVGKTHAFRQFLRLTGQDGRLEIEATNEVCWMRTFVDVEVEERGVMLVKAGRLKDVLNVVTDDRMTIEDVGTEILLAAGLRKEFSIPKSLIEEAWSGQEDRAKFDSGLLVSFADLTKAIDRCGVAVSRKEHRVFAGTDGMLVEFSNRDLTFVGTNGQVLSRQTIPAQNVDFDPTTIKGQMIIPLPTMELLGGLKGCETVLVAPGKELICFRAEGKEFKTIELVSRLSEGRFPPWKQVVPVKTRQATVRGYYLLKAIRQASILSDDGFVRLAFDHKANKGRATAVGQTSGRSRAEFAAESPASIEFRVSSKCLLDAVNAFPTDIDLRIGFTAPDAPIVLSEQDFDFVVVTASGSR